MYLQDDAEQISLNIMASTCSYLDGGSFHVKNSVFDFVNSEFIHCSDTNEWKMMVQAFQNKTHLSFSLTQFSLRFRYNLDSLFLDKELC